MGISGLWEVCSVKDSILIPAHLAKIVAPAGERKSLFQYSTSYKIQDRKKNLCLGVDIRQAEFFVQ